MPVSWGNMDYQLTDNQIWVGALLFIVYQPMVANKTGRYPLAQIISGFPENERAEVKHGIDALIEMNVFAMSGKDICITTMSESLFEALNHINGKPADAVEDMLKKHPAFSSLLARINADDRLAPPSDVGDTAPRSDDHIKTALPTPAKPARMKDKAFPVIIFILILVGLMLLGVALYELGSV